MWILQSIQKRCHFVHYFWCKSIKNKTSVANSKKLATLILSEYLINC